MFLTILHKVLRELQPIVGASSVLKEILPETPIVSFRRPKSVWCTHNFYHLEQNGLLSSKQFGLGIHDNIPVVSHITDVVIYPTVYPTIYPTITNLIGLIKSNLF